METDSGPVLENMNGIRSRRALAVCAAAVMAACVSAQGTQERDSEAWRAARKRRVSEDVEFIARSFVRRDPEVVRAFLDAGFHPDDARDDSGRTLLALAAMDGDFEIVEMLLAAGADVDIRDDKRRSPLYYAMVNGHKDIVSALLEAGAPYPNIWLLSFRKAFCVLPILCPSVPPF